MTTLAEFTTLRLGGPADCIVDCAADANLVQAVHDADERGIPVLLVAGGSNLVVADAGFRGTVARILTSGIERRGSERQALVRVRAGESWDAFVRSSVEACLSGIECLSGIPGSVGATPIQNVGAYGQDVSRTIESVRAYDRWTGKEQVLSGPECEFSYRSSVFKRSAGRWIVLDVTFALARSAKSQPITYGELAGALGVTVGETAPLREVREAVLRLRRKKGMVLDPGDLDTASAGSFFLNPLLSPDAFNRFARRTRDVLSEPGRPPAFPDASGAVKTSAAWLIEHAGFHRGYGNTSGIAISSKHPLALTNRGGGTATELVELAERIAGRVNDMFGVELTPEPVFVGVQWQRAASPAG